MKWDATEAARLDADAQALIEELVGPPDHESLIVDRLRAQLDGDKEREERAYALMQRRETFWRCIAALLNLFADGLDRRDMVTLHQAHAGIRALTIKEFSDDHRGGVQGGSS